MSVRQAPHNDEAEQSLLGAMLLARQAIEAAVPIVRPEHFYKPAHVHICEAIYDLHATGEPADPITVANHLRRRYGTLEGIGGDSRLVELQANGPAISNAARYASIVEETAGLRLLIGVAGEIAEIGYGTETPAEAFDHAEKILFDVTQRHQAGDVVSLSASLHQTLDVLEERSEREGQVIGTATGFIDLDDLLNGLRPGQLIVVGARPAMGKTAFALNAASHAALAQRLPVLFFSLEMSHIELTERILCSEARVDSSHLRSGRLTPKDWERLSHHTGRLADAPIDLYDNPNVTISEMRSKARAVKSQRGGLGLVVVDYVQLMSGGNAENETLRITEISRGCKILARELDVPVMILSQMNRGLEQRSDKRPLLSDLRQSGSLEQDADVVVLLYRDEVYNRESPDLGIAELIIAKHRSGPTGLVRLAFSGQYTRFANMARA